MSLLRRHAHALALYLSRARACTLFTRSHIDAVRPVLKEDGQLGGAARAARHPEDLRRKREWGEREEE